jgi:hypothetical protein
VSERDAIERAARLCEADTRSDLAKDAGYEPEWFRHGKRLAAAIRALPPAELEEPTPEMIAEEAQFLINRLIELDWCDLDDTARDYYGHVVPSLSRLSGYLAMRAARPAGGREGGA